METHDQVLERITGGLNMGSGVLLAQLSTNASAYADHALWYAWGRQDAGDDRTKGTLSRLLGDDFGFADYVAVQAELYYSEVTYKLGSIPGMYRDYTSALGAVCLMVRFAS